MRTVRDPRTRRRTADITRLNVEIPKWLHYEMKLRAAELDLPLRDVVSEIMEDWLKKQRLPKTADGSRV